MLLADNARYAGLTGEGADGGQGDPWGEPGGARGPSTAQAVLRHAFLG